MKLTIMRGVPGSGKSYKAAQLGGLVLSTDDYFMKDGEYCFDGLEIVKAHIWNQARAAEALASSCPHVIIDNTNTQAWEAKPYVKLAMNLGYSIEFVESDTSWAKDAEECFRRNSHGVPLATIQWMLARFEPTLTVDGCLQSLAPWER